MVVLASNMGQLQSMILAALAVPAVASASLFVAYFLLLRYVAGARGYGWMLTVLACIVFVVVSTNSLGSWYDVDHSGTNRAGVGRVSSFPLWNFVLPGTIVLAAALFADTRSWRAALVPIAAAAAFVGGWFAAMRLDSDGLVKATGIVFVLWHLVSFFGLWAFAFPAWRSRVRAARGACTKCEYNLTGLNMNINRCPECGTIFHPQQPAPKLRTQDR